ncbi:MAG: DUF222 domain-containing protein [Dermatophilaceae bacterium]
MEGPSIVIGELRQRLQKLEKQHEALSGGATPAFLRSLGRAERGAPGFGESVDQPASGVGSDPGATADPGGAGGSGASGDSCGSGGAGTGHASGAAAHGAAGSSDGASAGASASAGAGAGGRRTKVVPAPTGPARRGPWASVPAPSELEPDPVAGLSDLGSAWSNADDWYDAEVAAGRGPVPVDRGRIDPTLVTIDAVLGTSLARHDKPHLTFAAEHVAAIRGSHDVMLVQIVSELLTREGDLPRGLKPVDWLRGVDPTLTAAAAKAFVTVATAMVEPRWQRLRTEVIMQLVTVPKAAAIVDFYQRTSPVADADQLGPVIDELISQAQSARPEELARMIREETDHVTPPKDADELERGQRAARGLWFGQPDTAGMVRMRGTLDPEAAVVIQSAVDALAAPQPEKDEYGHTIAPDPRSPAKRRADALVDIVGRGVAAADGVPVTDKAKVVVTISLDALQGKVRGTGMTLAGAALTASIVRRLACQAAIIPVVLGSSSEPLDVARKQRFVTRAMRLALNLRDKGCSWRGCSTPATWCDAHHVLPWYQGGRTMLRNFALLCSRHHHYVHSHDLTATVTAGSVTWHE